MWTARIAMGLTSRWLAWDLALGVAFAIFMAQRSIIASRFAATMSRPTRRHDRWYWRLGRVVLSVQTVMLLIVFGGSLCLIAIVLLAIAPVLLTLAFFVYSALMMLLGLFSSVAWFLMRTMYRQGIVDLVRDRPSAAQRTWMALEQSQYPGQAGIAKRP